MNILWIVAGLLYILYKALKEDSSVTLSTIAFAFLIMLPGAAVGILRYIAENNPDAQIPAFIISCVIGVFWIGFLIREGFSSYKPSEKQRESLKKSNDKLEEYWYEQMRAAGYDLKPEYMLNSYHHWTQYKKQTPKDCFDAVSFNKEMELDKMSEEQLADIIGINLKKYYEPTHKQMYYINNSSPYRKEIRKGRVCRRYALMCRILTDEGLSVKGRYYTFLSDIITSEYYRDITRQIDEELALKNAELNVISQTQKRTLEHINTKLSSSVDDMKSIRVCADTALSHCDASLKTTVRYTEIENSVNELDKAINSVSQALENLNNTKF